MVGLFVVFTYNWLEDVAKILEVPGSRGNNMVNRRIRLIVPVFNKNNSLPPRQFLRTETLLKNKLAWENAHLTNY